MKKYYDLTEPHSMYAEVALEVTYFRGAPFILRDKESGDLVEFKTEVEMKEFIKDKLSDEKLGDYEFAELGLRIHDTKILTIPGAMGLKSLSPHQLSVLASIPPYWQMTFDDPDIEWQEVYCLWE